MNPKQPNRRTALKVIGAGIVTGLTATGSVLANDKDPGENEVILRHFRFNPTNATFSLDGGSVTVTWVHKEEFPKGVPHDVHIFESSAHSTELVSSDDLFLGDTYTVTFTKNNDGDLEIDDPSTEDVDATVDFDGSVTFHVHCSHHDPGMSGSLTIKE